MMDQYAGGDTLRTIGESFGISHERVRQLIDSRDPDFIPKINRKRERDRTRQREREERERQKERARPKGKCKVCGNPITRQNAKYACSTEHQQIWNRIKRFLDPTKRDEHLKAAARVILKKPDKYTPAQVKWAKRVLSDNPPQSRPHHFNQDSDAYKTFLEWKAEYGDQMGYVDSDVPE
jgi:hypothetical protein